MIIRQIGEIFSNEVFKQIKYLSHDYLLEADIIIIDLQSIETEISNSLEYYSNKAAMIPSSFIYLNETIKERTEQINQYLDKGGNLFIFYPEKPIFVVPVMDTKGITGNINFDLLSTIGLTSTDFSIKKQKGNIIEFNDDFKSFFVEFDCSYNFLFKKHVGKPIGNVIRSANPVSLQLPLSKGNIIILPFLYTVAEEYEEYLSLQRGCWRAFIELDRKLRSKKLLSEDKIKAPEWVTNYSIGSESIEKQKLTALKEDSQALEMKIAAQGNILEYYLDLKRLLFSTGSDLEQIVEKVLTEIGYKSELTLDNRDDLIISNDKEIAVVEIKGVNGSAAESQAAQLMKWVSTYHAENEHNPKGILIVNTFRNKPYGDRTEKSFPNQMLPYCRQMKLCMLTTAQLLEIYLDFKDLKISFEKIHKLLFSTVGELKYDSINKIYSISN